MEKKVLSISKREVIFVLIAILMVMVFSCRISYAEIEPIKIGALLDFTGVVADLGPRFERGIKLCLEQANYEVAGRPIELLVEDGGTDINISFDKARKLIEKDKVTVMIGPLMGGIQLGLAPYLAEQKVLNFSLINIEFPILEKYNNWIGYHGSTYSAYRTIGFYAYDELGYRTMATAGSDYAAGYSYLGGVVDAFKEKGGQVVQQQWVPLDVLDFNPYLVSMKDADAVAIFFASAGAVARYVTQHRELGIKTPILVTDIGTGLEVNTLQELGEKVVGMKGVDNYCWTLKTPKNEEFVAAFEKKYGMKPGGAELNAYVDTQIILAGLEATKGDASFDKLRPAILGLQIETPQGFTTFTPSGHAVIDRYIFEVKYMNGQYLLDPIRTYPKQVDPND